MSSVQQDRKQPVYRRLEGFLGYTSLFFIGLVLLLSIFLPTLASLVLILYSFMWLMKYSLNVIYTIHTYQNLRRWSSIDISDLNKSIITNFPKAIATLIKLKQKHSNRIGWSEKIQHQIQILKSNQDTKFADPNQIWHVCNFAVYNESFEVLQKSVQKIYDSGYPLDKILVVISQEERVGKDFNGEIREKFDKLNWTNTNLVNLDSNIVLNQKKLQTTKIPKTKFESSKLNLVFTEHPDGLIGEIKGKASNEDWGARIASIILSNNQVDHELVLVTSLDADSHLMPKFFENLSYTFCTTPNKFQCGFQPIHSYSSNFFDTSLWPRQVAMQTTLSNMTNLGISGQTPFFAIYSVPLKVLFDVNFWEKELIAEDFLLFTKCLIHYKGDFIVHPFYGEFEGDAIIADDFVEEIVGQYKQLQRWAWGGVEALPYMFKRFFLDPKGSKIPFYTRFKWIYLLFSNHFFWSSSPILFSLGLFLPQVFGGSSFRQLPIAQNLSIFSQYFATISFVYIISFGYISYVYLARNAAKGNKLKPGQSIMVLLQFIISPFLYGLMGIPALDAQIKGITGDYLGYWVTPKK